MQLLRSLELEIAVPRNPLKLFTSGGSGTVVKSLELKIAVPRKPSMLLMSKEGRELRSATASSNAVDLDTVLRLLKEQQDQQHDREFRRQEEDRRTLLKLEEDKLLMEEKWLQNELKLQNGREEQYKLEQSFKKRMSITQHLKTWDDTTETEAYLQSFETSMEEANIEEENWLPILRKQLVGKALSVFMELNATEKTHYLEVKDSLLEWLGSTPQQARRAIWLEKPRPDEDPRSFLQRISKALSRIKPLLNSAEDALNEFFHGVLLRNYSNEALLYVNQKANTSRYHRAEALQEIWEAMGFYEKKWMLRQQPQQPERQHQQRWRQNTWSGAPEGSSSKRKDGESPYIRGGAKHTRQSWSEPGKSRQQTRSPQRHSSGGGEASGNLSFNSKVCVAIVKNQGISSVIVRRNILLGELDHQGLTCLI